MEKRPELLSPAGDLEKLKYAITYGADAVYMAGERFGMRSSTQNFNSNDFEDGIKFARERGVKLYVTVNIMPRNQEISELPEYLEFLSSLNVDGIILADLGVLRLAKKYAPNIPIHISTQTSIVNYEAASFWHDFGAERVVLARELSFDEIATIRARVPKTLQIEAFVHGAMCMAYSGRCLISNYLTKRDANYGSCSQACRWKYKVVEEKRPNEYFPIEEHDDGTYLFNSKDLCMIEHIDKLVECGIDSFKIEGRSKTAYYAAGITNAYRKAIDFYFDNQSKMFKLPQHILDEVHKVSHRNYFTGFYFGDDGDSQYYDDVHYIREWDVAAMVIRSDDTGKTQFLLKNKFSMGDELELLQPNSEPYSFIATDIWDGDGQNKLDVLRHPDMIFILELPFKPHDYAILRKKKQ